MTGVAYNILKNKQKIHEYLEKLSKVFKGM